MIFFRLSKLSTVVRFVVVLILNFMLFVPSISFSEGAVKPKEGEYLDRIKELEKDKKQITDKLKVCTPPLSQACIELKTEITELDKQIKAQFDLLNADKLAKDKEKCQNFVKEFEDARTAAKTSCSNAGITGGNDLTESGKKSTTAPKKDVLLKCVFVANECNKPVSKSEDDEFDKELGKSLEAMIKSSRMSADGYNRAPQLNLPGSNTASSEGNIYVGNKCRPPPLTAQEMQDKITKLESDLTTKQNTLVEKKFTAQKEFADVQKKQNAMLTEERERVQRGAVTRRTEKQKREAAKLGFQAAARKKDLESIDVQQRITQAQTDQVSAMREKNLTLIKFKCENGYKQSLPKDNPSPRNNLGRNISSKRIMNLAIENCMRDTLDKLIAKENSSQAAIASLRLMAVSIEEEKRSIQQQEIQLLLDAAQEQAEQIQNDQGLNQDKYLAFELLKKEASDLTTTMNTQGVLF